MWSHRLAATLALTLVIAWLGTAARAEHDDPWKCLAVDAVSIDWYADTVCLGDDPRISDDWLDAEVLGHGALFLIHDWGCYVNAGAMVAGCGETRCGLLELERTPDGKWREDVVACRSPSNLVIVYVFGACVQDECAGGS